MSINYEKTSNHEKATLLLLTLKHSTVPVRKAAILERLHEISQKRGVAKAPPRTASIADLVTEETNILLLSDVVLESKRFGDEKNTVTLDTSTLQRVDFKHCRIYSSTKEITNEEIAKDSLTLFTKLTNSKIGLIIACRNSSDRFPNEIPTSAFIPTGISLTKKNIPTSQTFLKEMEKAPKEENVASIYYKEVKASSVEECCHDRLVNHSYSPICYKSKESIDSVQNSISYFLRQCGTLFITTICTPNSATAWSKLKNAVKHIKRPKIFIGRKSTIMQFITDIQGVRTLLYDNDSFSKEFIVVPQEADSTTLELFTASSNEIQLVFLGNYLETCSEEEMTELKTNKWWPDDSNNPPSKEVEASEVEIAGTPGIPISIEDWLSMGKNTIER